MELDDLKDSFMLEATELLDEAEDALLEYDNEGNFLDSYNKVFRAFHSLKGASGMFGLDVLQEHMHKLETLLDGVEEEFPQGAVDYFLGGVDQARHYFSDGKIVFSHVTSFSKDEQVQNSQESKNHVERREEREVIKNESGKGYVYVVDDEQLIVDLVSDCLEEVGYKVRAFLDGSLVIKEIENDMPDMIVSDINMPELDGLSMISKLKEMNIELPIVFVSAYVTKEAVLNGLENGAHYFIEKPFDEKYLISLVSNISHILNTKNILNKSIDYILYQFANHEDLLRQNGKTKEIDLMKNEISNLINLRKQVA